MDSPTVAETLGYANFRMGVCARWSGYSNYMHIIGITNLLL